MRLFSLVLLLVFATTSHMYVGSTPPDMSPDDCVWAGRSMIRAQRSHSEKKLVEMVRKFLTLDEPSREPLSSFRPLTLAEFLMHGGDPAGAVFSLSGDNTQLHHEGAAASQLSSGVRALFKEGTYVIAFSQQKSLDGFFVMGTRDRERVEGLVKQAYDEFQNSKTVSVWRPQPFVATPRTLAICKSGASSPRQK